MKHGIPDEIWDAAITDIQKYVHEGKSPSKKEAAGLLQTLLGATRAAVKLAQAEAYGLEAKELTAARKQCRDQCLADLKDTPGVSHRTASKIFQTLWP